MTPTEELIVRAARVANASPSDWDMFIAALANFSTSQNIICVQSALEELPRNQGRAQGTAHLLQLLANCRMSAGKIERK